MGYSHYEKNQTICNNEAENLDCETYAELCKEYLKATNSLFRLCRIPFRPYMQLCAHPNRTKIAHRSKNKI